MSWAGVWVGLWESQQGEPSGIVNAAATLAGAGAIVASAEVSQRFEQQQPTGGGYVHHYQRPRRYALAGLLAFGVGSVSLSARVTESARATANAALVAKGSGYASLSASGVFGASVRTVASASMLAGPTVLAGSAATIQGSSRTTLTAAIVKRNVVPIRPQLELADDEIAAILLMMAA